MRQILQSANFDDLPANYSVLLDGDELPLDSKITRWGDQHYQGLRGVSWDSLCDTEETSGQVEVHVVTAEPIDLSTLTANDQPMRRTQGLSLAGQKTAKEEAAAAKAKAALRPQMLHDRLPPYTTPFPLPALSTAEHWSIASIEEMLKFPQNYAENEEKNFAEFNDTIGGVYLMGRQIAQILDLEGPSNTGALNCDAMEYYTKLLNRSTRLPHLRARQHLPHIP